MTDKKFDWSRVETQIQELQAEIRDVLKRMESAVGKEAETLKPRLKAAQEKLQELRETTAEAWGDLKPGLQKAWAELQASFGQAASRFKTPPKE
jgi:hypothetical protein